MRTRHARQIRKGILLAREFANSLWYGEPEGRWLAILWEFERKDSYPLTLEHKATKRELTELRKRGPWLP